MGDCKKAAAPVGVLLRDFFMPALKRQLHELSFWSGMLVLLLRRDGGVWGHIDAIDWAFPDFFLRGKASGMATGETKRNDQNTNEIEREGVQNRLKEVGCVRRGG